ncbi:MAG: hypothetical protein K1X61_02230 [Chitinophagales bacterium]|nr:hypothetical protein [Chitinophagales bacterium]
MKKIIAALFVLIIIASCNRSVCPAYLNGEATGTSGTKAKKMELFPPAMKKK